MVVLLELYRRRRPSEDVKRVTTFTLWISLASGLVAAGLGILRAAGGGYEVHAVETHRWTGLAVVAFSCFTLAVQKFSYRDEARRAWTYAYRGLLATTLVLLMIAGHVGGNLTHGSKYLTENAPEFVREMLDDTPDEAEPATAAELDEQQKFFAGKVQPILERKCISCHGPEKQKGGFRLDQPQVVAKGDKKKVKAAIKPGSPRKSELVRLITLPPGDDEIMPPEGREALTAEEILTLIR